MPAFVFPQFDKVSPLCETMTVAHCWTLKCVPDRNMPDVARESVNDFQVGVSRSVHRNSVGLEIQIRGYRTWDDLSGNLGAIVVSQAQSL